MTPHLNINKEDIANVVLMPGDPLRAKYIAETYLKDYKLINTVRNNLGYTGYYKDKKISVISSGMGIPSIGIYSYELFKKYDVDLIIRVGSCGSYVSNINVHDVIVVKESFTDSNYGVIRSNVDSKFIFPDLDITNKLYEISKNFKVNSFLERIYTSDVFYKENDNFLDIVKNYNCVAVEMECFGLFFNAKSLNKKAAAILTVSDSFITGEKITSEEREEDFDNMIKIALESL